MKKKIRKVTGNPKRTTKISEDERHRKNKKSQNNTRKTKDRATRNLPNIGFS